MPKENALVPMDNLRISTRIYTIRDKQVMIDSDLAELYQVETRILNQAVKRNINRFPEQFMFLLSEEEYKCLISQFVISNNENARGGRRKMPYAFTEQGIAMLSAVLRSDVAVDVSIKIMDTFVEMRRFLINNKELFSRLDRVELKQLESDKKLEEIFNYIATKEEIKQKIFFNGQIYDAFSFIVELIRKARKSLMLIDNYIDVETLNLLSKKNEDVNIIILTSRKVSLSTKDILKFNSQYPKLIVKNTNEFHDRFLIIDEKEVYHIGASVKDAGKKSFAISKIEDYRLIQNFLGIIYKR